MSFVLDCLNETLVAVFVVFVVNHFFRSTRMTVDRIVHTVAGTFILASLALAKFHNPNWIWFTVFVGANLLQSGLTNWCLMSTILKKLGVPEGAGVGCSL